MSYQVKSRLTVAGAESIPVLKPDHVSLGKCVTSHQFIRKYATIQSLDIVNMLRDGCRFNGFKKMTIESSEEEGFVNMHHVLLLDTLDGDSSKEVCVRRKNYHQVTMHKLKEQNEVVTDSNSVVIIVYNTEGFLEYFYFGRKKIKLYKMVPVHVVDSFKVYLTSDILYVSFEDHMSVINFKHDQPFEKNVKITTNYFPLCLSSEMLVLRAERNERPVNSQLLFCDSLEEDIAPTQIILEKELMTDLLSCKIVIVNVCGSILWIASGNDKFTIYLFTKSRELNFCKTVDLHSFYPDAESFLFERYCFCAGTQQAFLLYIKDDRQSASSFIIVIDLLKMHVISILEMELTLNRKPDLFMYPSRDGGKLFVQETFENRVIFYQVFSLLPTGLSLQNITKQMIWKYFTEEEVFEALLPKKLHDELLIGL